MYLSSSAFQLLLNCRIVMVAISTILVLGKPINAVEWVAVILLTTGAVQYNLSGRARARSAPCSYGPYVQVGSWSEVAQTTI